MAPDPLRATPADLEAVQTLTAWLSPAYPVGSYSYSHGLEWEVGAGRVASAPALAAWTGDILRYGGGRTDVVLLAAAYRAEDPAAIAELAEALAPSAERHLETMAQGAAFARTTSAAWETPVPPAPYPVAVGIAARARGLPLELTATLYLQAFAAALVSAGVRLIPLGQTDGQRITRALVPLVAEIAQAALAAPPEAIGGIAVAADIAAMRHETQYSRLYRS